MAISRKNARRIVVDAETYQWAVSEDAGYNVLVVQLATGKGQKLQVTVDWDAPDDGDPLAAVGPAPITPKLVKEIVRMASIQGWRPDKLILQPFCCRLEPDNSLSALHS